MFLIYDAWWSIVLWPYFLRLVFNLQPLRALVIMVEQPCSHPTTHHWHQLQFIICLNREAKIVFWHKPPLHELCSWGHRHLWSCVRPEANKVVFAWCMPRYFGIPASVTITVLGTFSVHEMPRICRTHQRPKLLSVFLGAGSCLQSVFHQHVAIC